MWVQVDALGSNGLRAACGMYDLGAWEVGPAPGQIVGQEAVKTEDDHLGGVRRAECVDLQKMVMHGAIVAQGRYPRPWGLAGRPRHVLGASNRAIRR